MSFEAKGVEAKYSLQHIVQTTSEILGVPVQLHQIVGEIGSEAETCSRSVLFLKILHFHPEEGGGDKLCQRILLGDIYVNDALVQHESTCIYYHHPDFFQSINVYLLPKEIEFK
jgi:phosphoglycerate kinase